MISATNEVAINGSRDYGTTVSAATFEPSYEAYARMTNSSVYLSARATDGSGTFARLDFSPLEAGVASPFPTTFYQNITNQPIFANGTKCDNQIRLFNSTLNEGEFAPVPVKGTISSNISPLDVSYGLGGVFGLLIDTPFIEYNNLDCPSLKGYTSTGSGD